MTDSTGTLTIDRSATVNETIVKHPAAVAVFNALGIDACCGGDAPIDEAARRDGVDVNALLAALEAICQEARRAR